MMNPKRAKNLCVLITQQSETVAHVKLPAIALHLLDELIPSSAKKTISEQGIDLTEIKNEAIASNFSPQLLFELDNGLRRYRVWLE